MRKFLITVCMLHGILLQGQIQHGPKDDNFRVFDAGAIIGFNASQVDGDNLAGFNKIGLNTGALAHINFNRQWSLGFELLFTQKGSGTFPNADQQDTYKLTLNYAEVPVFVTFNDKSRMLFQAGFAYGRLFKIKEIINGIENLNNEDAFEKDELSYLFGATVLVGENKHFGINIRYAGSITSIGKSSNPQVSGLINRLIALRGIYCF
ncbi:MAG: outer membrane beta-barrel protein [Chitinophagales bacterium]